VAGLAATLGSGAMTNGMDEIVKSRVAFITGSNTTVNHPVFASMIKRAVREQGLRLIIADPRRIDLVDFADLHLQQKNGTDTALLSGIARIILDNGWEDTAYIQERCEGFEAFKASLGEWTPERTSEITGVPISQLYEAARLYTSLKPGALYYCMGITQHSHGVDNVKACVNLQLLTGNLGVEGGGVNPLRGQNNVQGACDMGGLPNVFSGYQPVTNEEARKRFSERWGAELSGKVGMTLTEMLPAAGTKIHALYILGENPMVSDPDLGHVEKELGRLDLLVVQDIFLTETARFADVVLPATTFAEKRGTFTNTERRVQFQEPAVRPPPGVRQDWEILADLAARFGHVFPRSPEAIFEEIRATTPAYAGLTFERLAEVGICWPCPNESHPGTRTLHKGRFSRGLGLFTPILWRPPAEEPDTDWPMTLSTGRLLVHYHTRTMTRRANVLEAILDAGYVEVHPADAERLGLADGSMARVSTRRGEIETRVFVTPRGKPGSLFVPFHFGESAANRLTNAALDPIAKIPEFKVCAASIQPAGKKEASAR
jgi:predicted molibdopterin-dependent oxidoreductase YjgC